jgi:poly-gamma-glutamate capsule biosynthesis protein CapA/YwtB (metallophosphatase superfamily)
MRRYRIPVRVRFAIGLLTSCLCVVVFLQRGNEAFAQQVAGREPANATATNVPDGFTVAAVGDIIEAHPATGYPENKPIAAIFHSADVSVGNFEGAIVDYRQYKIPQNIISHYWALNGEPGVAKDLKAMGINMVGRANNHQSDWGLDGARETDRWLDEAGLVHAGDGETRTLAREAQYFDTPKGRVGLISINSSTSDPQQIAIDANGRVPARPGANPLRLIRYAIVTADQMDALRKIHDAYPRGSDAGNNRSVAADTLSAPAYEFMNPIASNELYLFGMWYRVGDKPGFSYKMDSLDEREILQNIRSAKQNCDFLIVMIHAHQEPGADFITQLTHEAIDAGADEWVGTGPHRMLGVEIYKNRPIFHSLGDLFFEINLAVQPASQEERESYGPEIAEMDEASFAGSFWNHMPREPIYESAIVVSKFDHNQLSEIRILPVDLGWERRPADRGSPRIASPEIAQQFLQTLQKLSTPYGVNVAIEGNAGVIHVSPGPNGSPEKR